MARHKHGMFSGLSPRNGSNGNGKHGGSTIPKGGRVPTRAELAAHEKAMKKGR
jgi:hypothetical protein